MKKIELLAPAGNKESLKAAINAGADAVYLGGYMFGARSFSGNFSNEELVEAITYAHIMGVKVYVTTNTLVYENEVEIFMEYIDFLHKNNVDAVIIQDIGMLDLVRKTYPNLEIHASTQMHIHNLEGAKFLEEINIKRCVLARETSIDEIKYIKENSNIELEIFVHGALCVSYSGQCLMSSMIGNRSGNRGTCAQTCRKKYKLFKDKELGDGYLISPKDLFTVNSINQLIEIGVSSLKIEGRMKRPEYVYEIVKIYRDAIDEYYLKSKITVEEETIKNAKKLFNREFTKGFLFNEQNNNFTNEFRGNHMGIEIGSVINYKNNRVTIKLTDNVSINDGLRIIAKEDVGFNINNFYINQVLVKTATIGDIIEFELKHQVEIGSKVLKTTDYLQLEEIKEKINLKKFISITGIITIKESNLIELVISDKNHRISVKSNDIVTKAINQPTTKDMVLKQLNKTNDSNYHFTNIEVNIEENVFVSVKELNELRRASFALLDMKRDYQIPYEKSDYKIELPDFKKEDNINVLLYDDLQYDLFRKEKFNKIYTDNIRIKGSIKRMPRVIISHEEERELVLASDMGSLRFYNKFETDSSFNVTNSYALAFLHSVGSLKVTLSHELNFEQITEITNNYKTRYNKLPNAEVIVYGYPEVMINKFNLLDKYNIKDFGYIIDELNNKYYIDQINDRMRIFNFVKKEDMDIKKYFNIGVNNVRFDISKFDCEYNKIISYVKQHN